MKDLYIGDFNPPDDGSSSSKGILEKEKAGGDDDMLRLECLRPNLNEIKS